MGTGLSAAKLEEKFRNSAEYKDKLRNSADAAKTDFAEMIHIFQIVQLYKDLLGREPDVGGLKNWVTHMNKGMKKDVVAKYMKSSPEYKSKNGVQSWPNGASCNCYLERYRDLKKAFGSNCAHAWHHYQTHGIKEKRNPKCPELLNDGKNIVQKNVPGVEYNFGDGHSVYGKRRRRRLFEVISDTLGKSGKKETHISIKPTAFRTITCNAKMRFKQPVNTVWKFDLNELNKYESVYIEPEIRKCNRGTPTLFNAASCRKPDWFPTHGRKGCIVPTPGIHIIDYPTNINSKNRVIYHTRSTHTENYKVLIDDQIRISSDKGLGWDFDLQFYVCFKGCSNGYGFDHESICKKCRENEQSEPGSTTCINKLLIDTVKHLEDMKTVQNDLSIRNSRLWQKEEIRVDYDKLMAKRKEKDDENEKSFCENERDKGTVTFPAIALSNEVELNEDTSCIDTNRDELLKSFCSFRMDLEKLFKIQNIDKRAKTFWPNICCKERKDKTLEVCEDPSGLVQRKDIIPFALSQGGNYSRHNLYVEVTDAIKKNGFLHNGMMKLINSLQLSDKEKKTTAAKESVDSFFNDVSLCGPRIVNAPDAKDEKKLCQLFIPYQHSLTQFYNLIEGLLVKPMKIQGSFLETMETTFVKRQVAGKKRLGKNPMQTLQLKKKDSETSTLCKPLEKEFGPTELAKMKPTYCMGYNHLDLYTSDIKNLAIHYLKKNISSKYEKYMINLKRFLRYDVKDTSCPATPLFTPNDISIQQVNMDTLGNETEWVAVVNLNSQNKNGYLQSELPRCKAKDYLIGAKVNVKAYIDTDSCCDGWKDYTKCHSKEACEGKLQKLKDTEDNHYSKDIKLTGTKYTVKNSHLSERRRRLLKGRGGRC
jgi:hypothetical protein